MQVDGIYFRTVAVFDVSQTEGDPLPEFDLAKDVQGDDLAGLVPSLVEFAEGKGYTVSFEELQKGQGEGYCRYSDHSIHVMSSNPVNMQVKTLAHEIAHAIMHEKGRDGALFEANRRERIETEAESVAFVVLNVLGFDTGEYSFKYVTVWTQGEDTAKKIRESGARIQKAADEILAHLIRDRTDGRVAAD
ncbi:MAG: ImmA/IrrE family metallo-endopeptidase [Bacillota bacterium]|nr:ImmA/IrrE family metallo-endopeptidase [Bacillota bacterium]